MSDIRGRAEGKSEWRDILATKGGQLVIGSRLLLTKSKKVLAATTDYAAEDVLSDSGGTTWQFKSITDESGGGGTIWMMKCQCSTTALAPRITLYLFDATPTSALTDNAANTAVAAADQERYLGKVDFLAWEDLGGLSESIVTPSTYGNLPILFVLASGRTIHGIAVTRDAITGEAANMTLNFQMFVEPFNGKLVS